MALENFDNQIDIKDLAIEAGPRLNFDVERDIHEGDWAPMFDCLGEQGNPLPYQRILVDLKNLSPHRTGQWLKAHQSSKYLKDWPTDTSSNYQEEAFARHMACMKILFPDEPIDDSLFSLKDAPRLLRRLDKNPADTTAYLTVAFSLHVVYPSAFGPGNFSGRQLDNLFKQFDRYIQDYHLASMLADKLAKLRVLSMDPAIWQKYLTEQAWKDMRGNLEDYRDWLHKRIESPWKFGSLASDMAILSAKSVEVTDQGLVIEPPDKNETDNLPQQRNF